MGVRPPSDDASEPDVIEFGIAALEPTLADAGLEYPADVPTIRSEIGHVEVPYDAAGNTMRLETALDELDQRTFETQRNLLNALHPVFERKRQAAGRSLLAQLRGLVPF
jgi:hypothetical protein